MGGSESLFDGVSGLSNHQQWMNVIGNNIANVNTTGFKDQQFNFADLIYQTLSGASTSVSAGKGGTDFIQIGLGTNTGSILSNQQQGSLQTTNLNSDFAIQGDGFFVLSDGQATHYSRDGNFLVDGAGNLNAASNGFHLQGYGLKQVGNNVTIDNTKVVNLTVPQTINPAQVTTSLDLIGNVDSRVTTPQTQSIGIYDSLGQLHNVVLTFTPPAFAGGNWFVGATAADLQPGATIMVAGGNGAAFGGSAPLGEAAVHFNALGQLDGTVTPLTLSFSNGVSGGAPLQPQPPQPWVIPGTTVNTNAVQACAQLNINDPQTGALTAFASPTATSTQAVANAQPILSAQNTTAIITGNLQAQPADEIQNVLVTATGGTFTLSFRGQTTAAIAFNATTAVVQADLQALSSIGAGNATVTGAPGNYTITFTGGLALQDVPQITANGAALTPAGSLAAATTVSDGTGPTTMMINAADSTGLIHCYAIQLTPTSATGTSYQTRLESVDGEGVLSGNLQPPSGAAAAVTDTFKQPDSNGTLHTYALTFTTAGGAGATWQTSLTIDGVAATAAQFTPADPFAPGNQQATIKIAAGFFGANTRAQNLNLDYSNLTTTGAANSVIGSASPFDGAVGQPAIGTGLGTITYSTVGGVTTVNGGIQKLAIPVDQLNDLNVDETLTLDLSHVTNNASQMSGLIPPSTGSNGNAAGTLKDFNVDQTGIVRGVYTNGFTQTIGQILLATFENPGGLQREGHNDLQVSASSGVVNVGTPGSGKFGTLAEGNIETSNVDLANEFSNMILAERGFQANSRMITTSDTMLQDVIQMKQSA